MRKKRKLRLYRRSCVGVLTDAYRGNVITGYRLVMPDVRMMDSGSLVEGRTKKRILTKPKSNRIDIKRKY